jgi:hypothetical protein
MIWTIFNDIVELIQVLFELGIDPLDWVDEEQLVYFQGSSIRDQTVRLRNKTSQPV